jgi:hypothetical protein
LHCGSKWRLQLVKAIVRPTVAGGASPVLAQIAHLQSRLSAALASLDAAGQPPADLIDQLGGWSAVAVLAPTLIDNGLLAR